MSTLRFLGPDLVLLAVFGTWLAVLNSQYPAQWTFVQGTFILPLIVLTGFAIISTVVRLRYGKGSSARERLPNPLELLRDWMPFVLVAFVYENLHEFTHMIHPTTIDATLRAWDQAIFSTDVALILEKITGPAMTEFMTIAYALYFVWPTVILGLLYGQRESIKFREFMLANSLAFYIGFLGYILLPAIGPRYFMPEVFHASLNGLWISDQAEAAWHSMRAVNTDCFPSLHTALSTISLIYNWRLRSLWRWGRHWFVITTPLIVSLWLSTLYLRYHWFVDVIAGWATAILCSWIAPRFTRWYYLKILGSVPEVSTDRP